MHENMSFIYKCPYCLLELETKGDYLDHVQSHADIDTSYKLHKSACKESVQIFRRFFPPTKVEIKDCFDDIFFEDIENFLKVKLAKFPSYKLSLTLRTDMGFMSDGQVCVLLAAYKPNYKKDCFFFFLGRNFCYKPLVYSFRLPDYNKK